MRKEQDTDEGVTFLLTDSPQECMIRIRKPEDETRRFSGRRPRRNPDKGKRRIMRIFRTDRLTRRQISVQSIPVKHCTEYCVLTAR